MALNISDETAYSTVLYYNVNKNFDYDKVVYLEFFSKLYAANQVGAIEESDILEFKNELLPLVLEHSPTGSNTPLVSEFMSATTSAIAKTIRTFAKSATVKMLTIFGEYGLSYFNIKFEDIGKTGSSGDILQPIQNELGASLKLNEEIQNGIKTIISAAKSNPKFLAFLDEFSAQTELTNVSLKESALDIQEKNPDAFAAAKNTDVTNAINELIENQNSNSKKIDALYQYFQSQIENAGQKKTYEEINYVFGEINAGIYIFTTVLSEFDNEKSQEIAAALLAVTKVAYMAYVMSAAPAYAAFGPVGLIAAAITAVISIGKALKNKKKKDNAMKAMFEALRSISKQIRLVQEILIYETKYIKQNLEGLYEAIESDIVSIALTLDDVIDLSKLTLEDISDLSNKIDSKFDNLYRLLLEGIYLDEKIFEAIYLKDKRYWLTAKSGASGGLSASEFDRAASTFVEFAVSAGQTAFKAYPKIVDHNSLGYLHEVADEIGIVSINDHDNLAHLEIWTEGVRQYIELIRQYPEYVHAPTGPVRKVVDELELLHSEGTKIESFLADIVSVKGRLAPDKISKATTFLRDRLKEFERGIRLRILDEIEREFYGFNPWRPDKSVFDLTDFESVTRKLEESAVLDLFSFAEVPALKNGVSLPGIARSIDPTYLYLIRSGVAVPSLRFSANYNVDGWSGVGSIPDNDLHYYHLFSVPVETDFNEIAYVQARHGRIVFSVDIEVTENTGLGVPPKKDTPYYGPHNSVGALEISQQKGTYFIFWNRLLFDYEFEKWEHLVAKKEVRVLRSAIAQYGKDWEDHQDELSKAIEAIRLDEDRLYTMSWDTENDGGPRKYVRILDDDSTRIYYSGTSIGVNLDFVGKAISAAKAKNLPLSYPKDSGSLPFVEGPQITPRDLVADSFISWWKLVTSTELDSNNPYAWIARVFGGDGYAFNLHWSNEIKVRFDVIDRIAKELSVEYAKPEQDVHGEEELVRIQKYLELLPAYCLASSHDLVVTTEVREPVYSTKKITKIVPLSEYYLYNPDLMTNAEPPSDCYKSEMKIGNNTIETWECRIEEKVKYIQNYNDVKYEFRISGIGSLAEIDGRAQALEHLKRAHSPPELDASRILLPKFDPFENEVFAGQDRIFAKLAEGIDTFSKHEYTPSVEVHKELSRLLGVLKSEVERISNINEMNAEF